MRKSLFIISMLGGLLFYSCSSTSTDSTIQFRVLLNSSPAEGGSVSPADGEYEEGSMLEISATAGEGWRFERWEGDMSSPDAMTEITVDADKNITAVFEKKSYALTVNTSGQGTVHEQVVPMNSTDYEAGTVVELTAIPNEGYEFVGWQGDLTGTNNPVQLTVDQPKEVTAVFEKKSFALTINTTGQGAVAKKPDEATYEFGAIVELTANADDGWEFSEWQGDLSSTDISIEVTMDSPKELTAIFTEATTNLFYLAENGVTIKCPEAQIGDKGTVNGIEYTKVVAEQINTSFAEKACTSGITDMVRMFSQASSFNGDISHWDVSAVTNMAYMFNGASAFNEDIGSWDVSAVTEMHFMFSGAAAFNQDIGEWDVSSVTNMNRLFKDAADFNQNIGDWDVSAVTIMLGMFSDAVTFNSDLNSWNVSAVTDMRFMFSDAIAFNQDIGHWDVSSVTDMGFMFYRADDFNQDIGGWNVSSVTDMGSMFFSAKSFNQDLSGWCVSNFNSEPNGFAANSALSESNKPNWGTCSQ